MDYTIGEVAKKFNLRPSTLRYYEKEGLIPFVERKENGVRVEDIEYIRSIECLKTTGMSIKDIKKFMTNHMQGDYKINDILNLIENQKKSILKQINELEKSLKI